MITLPRALASVWQGLGDSTGASAAVKLQVRWNFSTGQLEGLTLQPARRHDRTTPYTVEDLPAGSLELADLGYFCLEELQAKQASCAFRRLSVVLCVCLRCSGSFEVVVGLFESCLATCRVEKRRKRPATFQLMLESEDLT